MYGKAPATKAGAALIHLRVRGIAAFLRFPNSSPNQGCDATIHPNPTWLAIPSRITCVHLVTFGARVRAFLKPHTIPRCRGDAFHLGSTCRSAPFSAAIFVQFSLARLSSVLEFP